MYKNLLVCGMALLMCGCSAKAAGNEWNFFAHVLPNDK